MGSTVSYTIEELFSVFWSFVVEAPYNLAYLYNMVYVI